MQRNVIITGASSGIGRALALRYARDRATLGLLGRNPERLSSVVSECMALGAKVQFATIDVLDREALKAWLVGFDRANPVDILVANAGILSGIGAAGPLEQSDLTDRLMQTNIIGVLNTVQPLMGEMVSRGRGSIALMSSIAGFLPMPDMPSYSASKAAILHYGLALRAALRRSGVQVSVICPGFVATPMSDQIGGAPASQMAAAAAADRIHKGIQRNQAVIAFPRGLAFIARIGGMLPDWARWFVNPPTRFTISRRPD